MNLTLPAKKLWQTVPKNVRTKILNNVFCIRCPKAVGIGNVVGHVDRGDLILKGTCVKCGGSVTRVLELSQNAD